MNDNKKIAKNTLILYIRMLIIMGISIFTSRILLKALGVEDYGIYNVVGSAISLFTFLSTCLTPVTHRYLSVEIGRGNSEQLNRIFNISITIHLVIALFIVLMCESLGIWLLKYKLVIPSDRLYAANWCFQLSLLGMFLSIISVPYNALIISHEKMNVFACISFVDVILKLIICYLVISVSIDKLITYAALIVIIQLIDQSLYWIYCRRHFPESHFRFYPYEPLYKEMLGMVSWGLFAHVPYVVNMSLQNILLNVFFTPVVNAARGIALQVSTAIQQFGGNFQTSVTPQIIKSYAVDDIARTHSLIINSSRFTIYLLYIISLPVYLRMDEILSIWLVEVPEYTSSFIRISLLGGIVVCLQNPITIGIRAQGAIKYPFLWSGVVSLLNIPVCYMFLHWGYSPICVFVIQIIVEIIVVFVRIYYAKILIRLSVIEYVKKSIVYPMSVIIMASFLPVIWVMYFDDIFSNVLSIVVTTIVSLFSSILSIWFIGLKSSERFMILQTVSTKMRVLKIKKH